MARILVIDDEPSTLSILDERLREVGHHIVASRRGTDGIRLARELHPDLVLLELSLPDLSGTEVCRTLRDDEATRGLRIVILSARSEEIDRVVGFELGADDYVVKPFSIRELMLRIRNVLRRGQRVEPGPKDSYDAGIIRVDREAHRIRVAGREVQLTALEFRLLVALCEHPNQVRSREVLLKTVWGYGSRTTARTVDTRVKRLREKLGIAADYVETVRKVGYRFAPAGAPPGVGDRTASPASGARSDELVPSTPSSPGGVPSEIPLPSGPGPKASAPRVDVRSCEPRILRACPPGEDQVYPYRRREGGI
ncbi:MAG: winged helix-turn-helix domain-containing protein [Polyangiaceae bacterium]|nr:winged helix-turn-helix domain-containing protein [Polyangiaceae bacterium]